MTGHGRAKRCTQLRLQYDRMSEWTGQVLMTTEDGDDLGRLIPELADSNTSTPCHAEYDMPSEQVWKSTHSGWPSQCNIARTSVYFSGGIAMNSKHQKSWSVKNGLKASLKISRKTDKYEVVAVQPRMDKVQHKETEAVIGDMSTLVAKLS